MRPIFQKIFAIILGIVGGFGLLQYLARKYGRCPSCGGLVNTKKGKKKNANK